MQGASTEADAGAEDETGSDLDDVGTAEDWAVLASPAATPGRAAPATPSKARGIEASEDPVLEQRLWDAATAARQSNKTASTENVFTPDTRIRVTNTTVAPWRASLPALCRSKSPYVHLAPCTVLALGPACEQARHAGGSWGG